MAKSPNQKLKLLYLAEALLRRSDQEHPLSTSELINILARQDIAAERKSIYDDMEALQRFGFDVQRIVGQGGGYYIGHREFELPELKLLVDSIQSSKFITQKKTLALIRKIESLASSGQAQQLQRQVYVRNRVKSMNESVYYNVDELSTAILGNSDVRFRYFEYGADKKRHFRRNGDFYETSPFSLIWDDENYYLLGYDRQTAQFKHYRVDKMTEISLLNQARQGQEQFSQLDLSAYNKKVFGMFTGQIQQVTLCFANHLAGVVLDRFGAEPIFIAQGEERFTVTVPVAVSPQFFGWLFALGSDVQIVTPESVRQQMQEHLARVAKIYEVDSPGAE